MSRIFLSHSSQDNRQAMALKQWLKVQRPELANDIFLDIDPDAGLRPGQRWKGQLFKSNSRCEAVICLLSATWESSHECKTEYRTAEGLGKQILCARLEDFADTDITSEWQRCDLFAEGAKTEIRVPGGPPVYFNTAALDQLRRQIEGTGIGAENFVWPPTGDPRRAPYRGWEPFEAIDAGVFFGRDAAIVRGLDALRAMRRLGFESLFVVLGPSGSGKSSFLRAGLLPRLQREDRDFLPLGILRPGRAALTGDHGLAVAIHEARRDQGLRGTPLGEIKNACLHDPARVLELLVGLREATAARLADAGDEGVAPTLLLPLDQAEELFSADAGPQAEQYLMLIADLLGQINATEVGLIVAATIRTDRYEVMQNHPAVDGIYTVLFNELKPMPSSQFKDVITGPADRTEHSELQVKFAPDLVNRLLADATEGADTLPLLSLTLGRLYTDWTDAGTDQLTLANYEAMGGMRDVVDNEIEEILARSPYDRDTALRLLRSAFIPWLATINPDNDQPMRRVARYGDLPEASHPLINALVAKRLLVKDTRDGQVVVEVALESLLRQWDELAGWVREARQDLLNADDLQRNSAAWEIHSRDAAWLLTGTRLTDAETLADTAEFSDRLANVSDYLAASRAAEDERAEAEKRQQEAKLRDAEAHAVALRRRSQVLRRVLVATAVVALIALIGAIVAANATTRARHAQEQAQTRYREATAVRLDEEGAAILSGDRAGTTPQAFQELLAAHAIQERLAPSNGSKPNDGPLFDAQVKGYSTIKIVDTGRRVIFMALSPTGDRIATTGNSGDTGVQLWNAESGNRIGNRLQGEKGVAFSPDGARIAAGGSDGKVRIWDATTGGLLRTFSGPTQASTRVVFSSDGQRIAAGSDDGTAWVWNVHSGAPELTLRGHQGPVASLAFSANGQRIATGGADKTVQVWAAATGQHLHTLQGHSDTVTSVAFSPDGDLLASGSDDATVQLWNPETGTPLRGLEDQAPVSSVAWNPNPAKVELASAGVTGTVHLRDFRHGDVNGGVVDTLFPTQSFLVNEVAFTADGSRLAAGADNTVHIWSPKLAEPMTTDSGYITGVAYSLDGRRIAAAGQDGNVQLWSPQTADMLGRPMVGHSGPLMGVAFDPGEELIAAGGDDGTVPLWNPDTGQLVRTLSQHSARVNSVAFSSDGHLLASGSADGIVRLWNPDTGQLVRTLTESSDDVKAVAFSPVEHLVAASSSGQRIFVWDTDTGKLRNTVTTPAPVGAMAFSPDGRRLVTGGDSSVWLLDIDRGQPAMDPLIGHTSVVFGVAFSPDGRFIASASFDEHVRLWDAATGTPVGSAMVGHNGYVLNVAFSPDSRQIVSGDDGELRLWPGSPSVPDLCAKLTANPSHRQWNDFVAPDIDYIKVCPNLPVPPDASAR